MIFYEFIHNKNLNMTNTNNSASNEVTTKVVERVLDDVIDVIDDIIEPKIHNKLKSNYDKLKSKVNKDEQWDVLDKSKINNSGVQSKQELSISIVNEDEKEELSQTVPAPSTPNGVTFSSSTLVLEPKEIESLSSSPVKLQKKYESESDFELKKMNTDETICQSEPELKKMNTDETICEEIPFVNFNEPIAELTTLKLYCGDRLAKIADRMKALPVVFQTAKHMTDVIRENPNVYELKKFDEFNVTYDDYLKHRFELSDKKSSFTSHNTYLQKESTKFQIEDARIIKYVKEILRIMKPLCDRYKDTDFL